MKLAAALFLVLLPIAAHARPSPSPVTAFEGDRYSARQAPVARPRRHAQRHRHYRHHARQRAAAVRQIALTEGMTREIGLASTGRPRAWCGWWLGHYLGMPLRHLWVARNWAQVGLSAGGPAPGVVVVWPHHVGIITGRRGNRWVIKSGNDGHRVRERARSVAGAIAFRRLRG